MMIAQVAHRLPQVRLRGGAEDLRRGALRLGVGRAEQHPPAPDPVLRPAYLEANGDELSVESDGGEIVDDRFGRIRCVVACRLSGHADPRAGLRKDIRTADLRNTLGRWEQGAGRSGATVRTAPCSRLRQILNGAGANVMTKSTKAAQASTRRDAGSGRCASSTGG